MRLLGIDFGSKRVGLALSEETGTMAFPHSVVVNDDTLLPEVVRIIEEEKVQKVIIGHSLDREGKPNPIHEGVSDFIAALTLETSVPIELEPEQYTTQEAIRTQGRNELTDASAAAIILNGYIARYAKKI